METELQLAANSLRDDAKESITSFVPEDEDNFVGMEMIMSFGTILLLAFLAGFQEEAKSIAKEKGKSTFRWLTSLVTDLFTGKESEKSAEAKERAKKAKALRKSMKDAEFKAALDRAEDAFRDELAEKLGKAKAAKLASKVRTVAEKELLTGG